MRFRGCIPEKVGIGRSSGGGFGLAVELPIKIPGLEHNVAQEIVESIHQIYPYTNATRGNVDVTLTVL